MITENEVLGWMESLARSQGLYGRLLRAYHEADEEGREAFINAINEAGVKDSLDFIFFIEQ